RIRTVNDFMQGASLGAAGPERAKPRGERFVPIQKRTAGETRGNRAGPLADNRARSRMLPFLAHVQSASSDTQRAFPPAPAARCHGCDWRARAASRTIAEILRRLIAEPRPVNARSAELIRGNSRCCQRDPSIAKIAACAEAWQSPSCSWTKPHTAHVGCRPSANPHCAERSEFHAGV